jgi:hypothetical protein
MQKHDKIQGSFAPLRMTKKQATARTGTGNGKDKDEIQRF